MEPITFKLTGSKDSKTCASAISKASTFETICHFNFIYCKIHSTFPTECLERFQHDQLILSIPTEVMRVIYKIALFVNDTYVV